MQYFNSERTLDTDMQLQSSGSTIQGLAQNEQRSSSRQEEIEQVTLRLTQNLQRSLDIEALLQLFCQEITSIVPCDSTSYENIDQNLGFTYGTNGTHICQYNLQLEGKYLGDLICTRNVPFGDQDLLIIESLASSLVYPLRNSLMYREAMNMALQDPLTGAGNRKSLEKAIKREKKLVERYDKPFSVLMIDIDFFKNINDQHGHSAGDLTLQTVSQTITDVIRQSDQLFRFGGEEFVVLLDNTKLGSAAILAERIRVAIEQSKTTCAANSIQVTISIGVAHYDKTKNMDDLFARADQALYHAKENGRNKVSIAAV